MNQITNAIILNAKIILSVKVGSKKHCFEINNIFRYACMALLLLLHIFEILFWLAIDYSDVPYILFYTYFFSFIFDCP